MEGRSSFFSGRYGFLWGLSILLLLVSIKADNTTEEIVDPTGNVNLSPFWQWISAYQCLQTKSSCTGNSTLTQGGLGNLTSNDIAEYCKKPNGCAQHAKAVLQCISLVKHDYKFMNGATVNDIYNAINQGCSSGNFTTQISNARKIYEGKAITFISVIVAWLLISYRSI